MTDHGLGRRPPTDHVHEEKYPLRMSTTVTQVEQFLPLPVSYSFRMVCLLLSLTL